MLSRDDLVAIKEVVVDPLSDRLEKLEESMAARVASIEARVGTLERGWSKVLWIAGLVTTAASIIGALLIDWIKAKAKAFFGS